MKELEPKELRRIIEPCDLDFKTTDDLNIDDKVVIVGQEKALKALEVATKMSGPHDNIYVAGGNKIGKTSVVKLFLEQTEQKTEFLSDWAYVHNFKNPYCPISLSFPAGEAKQFKADLEEFFKLFCKTLSEKLKDKKYQEFVFERQRDTEKIRVQMIEQFIQEAKKMGFIVEKTEDGEMTVRPSVSKKTLKKSLEIREEYESKIIYLFKKLEEFKLREMELKEAVSESNNKYFIDIFKGVLDDKLKPLLERYSDLKVESFLENIRQYLIDNAINFASPDDFNIQELVSFFSVNVIVDNSENKIPIIQAYSYDYSSFFGAIERIQTEENVFYADHNCIKAGFIHRANGGYLIIRLRDLLMSPFCDFIWAKLKEIIRQQKAGINNFIKLVEYGPIKTLEPEVIPLSIKVILVGDYWMYEGLSKFDEQFTRLFQKKVELDSIVAFNQKSQSQYVEYIAVFARRNGLLPLDVRAVAKIIEYGCEIASSASYLTLQLAYIRDILREADFWARKNGKENITIEDVETAIEAKRERSNIFEDKERKFIQEDIINIDVDGEKIGQVNGLSIYELTDCEFGIPSKITARTFYGTGNVISIDRNVKLAGPIHNKGSMILASYLRGRYGQNESLSLSASIVFEQNYDGIEGDSATLAETIAILSSLSGMPICQYLAITGSMKQYGEAQAIGGVNYKVAGWYITCKQKGLSGRQGVIIPETNIKELMLPQEIVEAVANGQFKIYAVGSIGEAAELMIGPMAEIDRKIKSRLRALTKKHKTNKKK